MLIESNHTIINEKTLEPVVFPVGGHTRAAFTKRDLEALRAGGYPWRAYADPAGYDPEAHNLDGVFALSGALEITQGFTDKTAEEMQAAADADEVATIADICAAAKKCIEDEIDPAGLIEFKDLAAQGNVYAQADEAWVRSVYASAEYRKALYLNGTWPVGEDITDFSQYAKKPYTVAEVQNWTP
jgi:hypothetical protein